MKTLQRRTVEGRIEVRSNEDGSVGVRGYAAVFDDPAHGEVIRSSAFNRSIAQKDNIRLLVNHAGVPLASTKAGTLTVGVDDHGEWFDAPNLDRANPTVQELLSAMSRGDIDQCSFAGYFVDVRMNNGIEEVFEVKQTDVSIVTYPWYESTEASITGDRALDGLALTLRSLAPEAREKVVAAAVERDEPEEIETPTETVESIVEVEAPRALTPAEARALLAARA